ncbi:MAG: CopG family transcriptional regulator [Clostridia bacterium]|nr:CopG family transcriptional regulator [Clostridia bacterium]
MSTTKKGRPTSSPKNTMLRVRIDNETLNKLDDCVQIEKSNRSDIVRKGINKLHNDIKK